MIIRVQIWWYRINSDHSASIPIILDQFRSFGINSYHLRSIPIIWDHIRSPRIKSLCSPIMIAHYGTLLTHYARQLLSRSCWSYSRQIPINLCSPDSYVYLLARFWSTSARQISIMICSPDSDQLLARQIPSNPVLQTLINLRSSYPTCPNF